LRKVLPCRAASISLAPEKETDPVDQALALSGRKDLKCGRRRGA
jgi:hypothetical protein